MVEGIDIPAVAGHLAHGIGAVLQQIPEGLGRIGATRQPTRHADDGDGLGPLARDVIEPRLELERDERQALRRELRNPLREIAHERPFPARRSASIRSTCSSDISSTWSITRPPPVSAGASLTTASALPARS